ncbi:MAG: class I SAM-dependent DNA methyltransferase [Coleofasciculus sp. G1-WW12-02]|uniref:DNA methyltransferase n=1 Tax=Coleofasciculus sp. G1-WW12-02 TaxID=3068483 RepID=UPI0032F7FA40
MTQVKRLQRVENFLKKWKGSQGNERANYQSFFQDLCTALGVDNPPPKGNIPGDPYCFDKEVKFFHSDRDVTTRFSDFYKEGHFLIEAKQGGETSGKGTAKRGTETYRKAMEKAFFQARSYTPFLPSKPPFLITCDIGSHFEVWTGFSGNYGGYGARERIELEDLLKPEVFQRFVLIFTDPQALNPEKYRARVTREVAEDLAKLAKWLEGQKQDAQMVANFLMRCIFTMFAEDVKLLKGEVFTKALKDRWIDNPSTFKPEIEVLWQTMNTGGNFGFEKILQFNGSFFDNATAFELPKKQLEVLFQAAEKDWSQVEPAIFGTLLERALDPKERSRLGAHYTPRSYVERLVRPVVIEPLRQRWELEIEPELKRLLKLKEGQLEPTAAQKKKAAAEIEEFLAELRSIRILDPACGSGNFLYVTLDLLKGLETEVVTRLVDVVGEVQLGLEQVNPSQFLGIEINPRAAAIAELVIWIGYLQWHFKRFGTAAPPEPILQKFHNIEYRDAVLACDGKEPDIDPETKQPRTRWGGRMMKHPVTGEDVPDPTDQIPIYCYINPRPAEWQDADYIVSNPPFIGNARMREILGDGYAETLRKVYKDVPDTVDYVMYWWHKAAELVRAGKVQRFGLITTNSIRQVRQRKVIDFHVKQKKSIRLIFAIPDHPWVDGGAAVRIAMTAAELDDPKKSVKTSQLGAVVVEDEGKTPEEVAEHVEVRSQNVGRIFSNLQAGADVTKSQSLSSHKELASKGFELGNSGFLISEPKKTNIDQDVVHPFLTGRDFSQIPETRYAIDVNHLSEAQLSLQFTRTYQWLLNKVKPERDINNDPKLRREWWRYRRSNASIRNGIQGLNRYIATTRTAKHRVFRFLSSEVMAESGIVMIFLEDAYFLGVLSSQVHFVWAMAQGSTLEDRPVYNHILCFYRFPFPDPTPVQKQNIRDLGERLDAHRKQVQVQHPDVTITGMYNLLEKLRTGQPFTDKDREYNNKALVSTLKQIHDELDAAVLDAYGWHHDISDEEILERLVALNAERAEEERNGLIRWLRPEYQAPDEVGRQQVIAGIIEPEEVKVTPAAQKTLPKKPKEQLAAIRDLLLSNSGEWTIEQIAAQFKGGQRQKKAIAENLERLEWFGILISREEGGVTRWQFAQIQQVA